MMIRKQVLTAAASLGTTFALATGIMASAESFPPRSNDDNHPALLVRSDMQQELTMRRSDLGSLERQLGNACFALIAKVVHGGGNFNRHAFDSPVSDLEAENVLVSPSQPCGKDPQRIEAQLNAYRHLRELIVQDSIVLRTGSE